MKIKLSKSDWELIGNKTGWLKKAEFKAQELETDFFPYSSPNMKHDYEQTKYNKYLTFTPKDTYKYYTFSIPKGIEPPKVGDKLTVNNEKGFIVPIVVESVKTPEDIAKGRGGPVAKSMEEQDIAFRVNALPVENKDENKTI